MEKLLGDGEVATHPFVVGELRVGNLNRRNVFLSLLENLPRVGECSHEEVLFLIEKSYLYGKGIGYFDAHLLCAAVINEVPLWTLDKRLAKMAKALSCRWR